MKIRKISESISLKEKLITDVTVLIDKLEYLKKFAEDKINDNNELDIFKQMSTIHTDIQLLSSKLNYRK
jgi:hypothetical protein